LFEFYALFKFVHVVAVIIWIGGVCALSVINARLTREQDRAVLMALLRQSGFYGAAIIAPAAVMTLIAGMATAGSAGLRFDSLWLTWGLLAILGSLLLGALPIRMTTAQLGKLTPIAESDDPRLIAARQRLTLLNAINVLLLLSTVWAMVFKPTL
jgi:uncharacterized membrane protein